jgi:uncharacterized membrane protein
VSFRGCFFLLLKRKEKSLTTKKHERTRKKKDTKNEEKTLKREKAKEEEKESILLLFSAFLRVFSCLFVVTSSSCAFLCVFVIDLLFFVLFVSSLSVLCVETSS